MAYYESLVNWRRERSVDLHVLHYVMMYRVPASALCIMYYVSAHQHAGVTSLTGSVCSDTNYGVMENVQLN